MSQWNATGTGRYAVSKMHQMGEVCCVKDAPDGEKNYEKITAKHLPLRTSGGYPEEDSCCSRKMLKWPSEDMIAEDSSLADVPWIAVCSSEGHTVNGFHS